jgi:hypothetical protein
VRKRIGVLATVLAAGSIAAGCGGGSDTTTTTTAGVSGVSGATGVAGTTIPKDEWISKADDICQQGNEALNKAQQGFQGSEADYATQVLVPNVQTQLDGINALPPPDQDAEQANQLLDDAQQAVDKIKSDPSSANTAFDDVNQEAKDFGLKVCGQG